MGAASIMGMNNVFYRAKHLLHGAYDDLARLAADADHRQAGGRQSRLRAVVAGGLLDQRLRRLPRVARGRCCARPASRASRSSTPCASRRSSPAPRRPSRSTPRSAPRRRSPSSSEHLTVAAGARGAGAHRQRQPSAAQALRRLRADAAEPHRHDPPLCVLVVPRATVFLPSASVAVTPPAAELRTLMREPLCAARRRSRRGLAARRTVALGCDLLSPPLVLGVSLGRVSRDVSAAGAGVQRAVGGSGRAPVGLAAAGGEDERVAARLAEVRADGGEAEDLDPSARLGREAGAVRRPARIAVALVGGVELAGERRLRRRGSCVRTSPLTANSTIVLAGAVGEGRRQPSAVCGLTSPSPMSASGVTHGTCE